ncbi:hypothetical protein [Candidatus Borrarchaeum sp.]|uniref:hypothetical protein n=1 Tax=Candidatus Borrarchaeum sp. TaxID=2846742 RepID=UPI00257A9F88|nr:hypothetical protein [Candidatus Borrarchaeum sp.]
MTIHNIFDLESCVKQNLCLLNHMVWYDYHIHTEDSLTRFFSLQTDVKSRLDRLVEFGILELSLCNSYVVSQDPLIQAVIEHVNDNDRIKRDLCNSCLAY